MMNCEIITGLWASFLMMALGVVGYLKIREGRYYRIRLLATASLGVIAIAVGLMRLASSARTLDLIGLALLGLGVVAFVQIYSAICEVAITWCGRIPCVVRLLTAKHIRLLKEIVDIIERDKLNCLIGGGMAYDALMTGYLSHIPDDLDVICLSQDAPAIWDALTRAGFVLSMRHPHQITARRKGDVVVDILVWHSGEGGKVHRFQFPDLFVIPGSLFIERQAVQLNGISFFVQGASMLACIAPWASRLHHRVFLQSASGQLMPTGQAQRREALIKVLVTEFDG
ncbi:MAG: hypothetical protein WCS52_08780 [bacterium]